MKLEQIKALLEVGAWDGVLPHIAQFFRYAHLPERLQAVSKPFCDLTAFTLTLPDNPERSTALRKLLEAKDAAVRAVVSE